MKTSHLHSSRGGAVLITALVLALLVGLVVGALLIISQQHNYLTARSQTWCSEIPIAEAGIEEAMEHINSSNSWLVRLATNGWTPLGSNVVKSREIGDGYYYTAISTSETPTIVSIGFGRIPLQTNFTRRIVTAVARKGIKWGFVGIHGVEMNGSTAYIDSFDSSDPRYSSNRLYDANLRRDMAGVATVSSARPALDTGTARIFGFAATGPGGTVAGTVGDGYWCETQTGVQLGHATDDFNMAFPPAEVTNNFNLLALPPLPGIVNGTNYGYVLGTGDYKIDGDLSLPVSGPTGGNLIVTGAARLYVTGKTTITGQGKLIVATNGTLVLYLGGDASLHGQGTFNEAGVATACSVLGLPTCKNIEYGSGTSWTSLIYAPQAEVEIGGGGHFYGSIVGATLKFTGTPALHYDEALGGASPFYKVVAWEEL